MIGTPPTIGVSADRPAGDEAAARARALAGELGLPLLSSDNPDTEILLVVTGDRLEARWRPGDSAASVTRSLGGKATTQRPGPVYVDLLAIDTTSNWGRSRKQPIARAVGMAKEPPGPPPTVLDATAGLGEDAWVLASLGCPVTAVERNPIVAALLRDGLRRAATVQPEVAARLILRQADARQVLSEQPKVDVVFLDPMFPHRSKAALERKEMRLLRRLAGEDADASELLDLALRTAAKRVVVKRPLHAPTLAGKPTAVHQGRSVRFDVYVP